MKFEEILGNNKIKKDLEISAQNETTAHSYLFIGPDGIGKKLIAENFARMILCQEHGEKKGCGTCSSCIKFDSSNNPDFFEIEPDGNSLKIAQIREMLENIYQKPIVSDKKVFIINDSENMTQEAQNSLLKTLEEPPEYVVIIMITSNENMLLNTVKSRCVKLNFQGLTKQEMNKYISQSGNESFSRMSDTLLEMCNGSIGKLIKVSNNIDEYNQVEKATNNLLNGGVKNSVDMFNNYSVLYDSKEIIMELLDYMMTIIFSYINRTGDSRMGVLNSVQLIEKTKRKLMSNTNYDMCIDELLLKII